MSKLRPLTRSLWVLVLALAAMPAMAQEGALRGAVDSSSAVDRIYNGVDLWRTPADGSTFMSFADRPIPAGFFCGGSEPFTGIVLFRGRPLVTVPEGAFGESDTVVQRLDDAVFNGKGIARTGIQLRALSLASIAPVETLCGRFDVSASLHGEQPVTQMKIVREHASGGFFKAPLELNVKLTFTPVDRGGAALELFENIQFPGLAIPWTSKVPAKRASDPAFVLVDTDGDATADTFVPGTSNFDRPRKMHTKLDYCKTFPDQCACHTYSGGETHCVPL